MRGRAATWLALACILVLGCLGPAHGQTRPPSQALPRVIDGTTGGSLDEPGDVGAGAASQSLPRVIEGPGDESGEVPGDEQTQATPQPLPHVIDAPTAAAESADTPAEESDAPPTPTGGTCEAVLIIAERTRLCPVEPPLPLGTTCECAYPPPPPGILPAPPDVGHVIP